jgi:putative oxidoreductase
VVEIDIASAVLRAVIGVAMLAHGYNHLLGPGGVAGTAGWFDGLGLRPASVHAWTSGLLELAAGAGLLLGLLTPLWTAATVGVAAVAGIAAHRVNGFFVFKDGYEYVLVLAAASIALSAVGPGRWSLDHLLGIDVSGAWVALGVLLLGSFGAAAVLAVCWRPAARSDA